MGQGREEGEKQSRRHLRLSFQVEQMRQASREAEMRDSLEGIRIARQIPRKRDKIYRSVCVLARTSKSVVLDNKSHIFMTSRKPCPSSAARQSSLLGTMGNGLVIPAIYTHVARSLTIEVIEIVWTKHIVGSNSLLTWPSALQFFALLATGLPPPLSHLTYL